MTARAAIRRRFHAFPRIARREHADRLGRTAGALPDRLVVGLTAAIFAVAAFAATWTVAVEQPATYAEADAPLVTGTIKAN